MITKSKICDKRVGRRGVYFCPSRVYKEYMINVLDLIKEKLIIIDVSPM
jgi:hypothetical protein